MKANVFFSFVIPTYNRLGSLKVVLESVIHQDYPKKDYEIIVVDNYAVQIAKEFVEAVNNGEPPVSYYHVTQRGAHCARNLGVQMAKGKYIVLLDDDCEADPRLLSAYKGVIQSGNAKMAGGRIEIKWDEWPPEPIRHFEYLMGKINISDQVQSIYIGGCVNGGNMVIDKELYLRIGGMEPDQVGQLIAGSGDVGLCHRVQALGYDIFWVPHALVYHRQFLNKNGCLRDLMRREFNNGICSAFEDTRKQKLNLAKKTVVPRMLTITVRLPEKIMKLACCSLINRPKVELYKRLLDIAKDSGYIFFCFRHLFCL